ncbi:PREDICTED: uncharacterized protein LOC104812510 isoform X2 [Tarenaya hassleriana]|uniref:uncharacterized protein LOC104812510 isoform X2 n=1 Tax=Tarenaya hassleriana TaxID=28532 RepID=UPI00053C479A|nr:PREDICTED: uncharacterized protein LOC104812510 isoform X2 [Tarenaya hassleriana]
MGPKGEKNPSPDQGNGFGCTKTEKGEGFVMIDVESFAPLLHRDLPSTPTFTMQRSLSRKGSGRNYSDRRIHYDPNGVEKETSMPQPQLLGGLGTPEKLAAAGDHHVGPIDLTATSTAVPTAGLPVHHTTVTAGSISDQSERRLAFSKKTSLKRSPTSWILDPKKVVLFFATLSSVGSILLIIFTLSMTKSSGEDITLD